MNMQFLYEGGQGHIVDENGVVLELFAIKTISSRIQFLRNKPPERPSKHVTLPDPDERNNDVDMELCNKRYCTVYADEDNTRFFHLFLRWVKRYYEDPESIFKKKKKSGRHRILREEHKQFLLNYIDENPSTVVADVVEKFEAKLCGLNVSRS
ncbi:uncharacterized protein BYT42DRAFT_625825 [Radiomyces spectabilis]|uniref:uncharacterized protein n=1 Tax=Radiomyces spectabilis TaxID=64574 RepID=UPI002220E80C|nr:uncharacterized protein BYT42DRAFT_625825 [Radiomyces spectabilis]KAI8367709.1 hypothetical protein BYT42DRAFT_625825 [Radiomyces spectabilis]